MEASTETFHSPPHQHPVIMSEDAQQTDDIGLQFPILKFDPEAYAEFVTDNDLSEEESRELLAIIWNIVVTFVDMGFGIEPVQQATACRNKEDGA